MAVLVLKLGRENALCIWSVSKPGLVKSLLSSPCAAIPAAATSTGKGVTARRTASSRLYASRTEN
jgi:hypothetical protein